MNVQERFERLVERIPESGCWLWLGSLNRGGYGTFGRKRASAHRVSWQLFHGPIPAGMEVCHHCDVPCCVNPAHLFVGTTSENILDAVRKGRVKVPYTQALKTHCPRGHDYTEANTRRYKGHRFCKACDKLRGNGWQRQRDARCASSA